MHRFVNDNRTISRRCVIPVRNIYQKSGHLSVKYKSYS